MSHDPERPTDSRSRNRSEQRRLFRAVLVFLVVVGGILIAFVYGATAAALGMVLLLAGAGILVLLWQLLVLMERLAK